jgi:hypothetical protein
VLCGRKIHRLGLVAAGGPTVLLDHPRLDRAAELAMVALGAPLPDCLLVLDAIAGRVSHRRILGRRRAFAIAYRASNRRSSQCGKERPALELPLAERYAAFVRHRALLWLSRPAGHGLRRSRRAASGNARPNTSIEHGVVVATAAGRQP